MALAVPDAFGDRGLLFGACYLLARRILAGLLLRPGRPALTPVSIGSFVTGPLVLAGGLVSGTRRNALWALAAIVDLAGPTLLKSRMRGTRYDSGHLTERFGLFLIIAIGESIVATAGPAAGTRLTAVVTLAVAVAFVVICGLWWVYFQFAADAMLHAPWPPPTSSSPWPATSSPTPTWP